MNKICFLLFLILMLSSLTGCSQENSFSPPPYAIIEEPTDYTIRTADGYRDYHYEKQEQETIYYGNKKTKVFHYSDCKYAQKISEASIIFDRDRNSLILKGYTSCGYCNP